MNENFDMNDFVSHISKNNGLFGIFANSDFGSTTLSMQIVGEVVKRKNGTVLVYSFEHTKERYRQRMHDMGICTEDILIFVDWRLTAEDIKSHIATSDNPILIVIDPIELWEPQVAKKLKHISDEFSIPILVNGCLPRNSGDYDPEHRPDLYSLVTTVSQREYMKFYEYKFLALLHRNHDCDREIGTVYRYNISNHAELIIKINRFAKLNSIFMNWDEEKSIFRF